MLTMKILTLKIRNHVREQPRNHCELYEIVGGKYKQVLSNARLMSITDRELAILIKRRLKGRPNVHLVIMQTVPGGSLGNVNNYTGAAYHRLLSTISESKKSVTNFLNKQLG